MYYLRKISEQTWFVKPALDSDAISELSTIDHDLSVWKFSGNSINSEEIDNLALALAMTRSKIEELYIVKIDLSKIQKKYKWTVALHEELGLSYFDRMNDKHTNLILEDFWHQGFLAEFIKKEIECVNNYVYYDVPTLEELLYKAVENGMLAESRVKERGGDWKRSLKKMQDLHRLQTAS